MAQLDPLSSTNLPTVAIVGRPNVGKSTLVNRIVGRRIAIVEEKPGVTRDRKEVEADWRGRSFVLIDTGGWMTEKSGDALDAKVSDQSAHAIEVADVVLFVVDGITGITEDDSMVTELIRRRKGPTLLLANKIDEDMHEPAIWELLALGVGTPHPVSAVHGRGVGDMLDELIEHLPEPEELPEPIPAAERDHLAIALVGRPNVGKSTLFNRLVGEERAIVHDMPGTTRDTVDTLVETEIGTIRFIDTAGMRRKARVDEDTEYYSSLRALKAVDGADVALLVVDATVGVTHQDQRLAERVDGAGCPIVVLLNKWDLLDTDQREDIAIQIERRLHFLGESPVLRISALSGRNVHKLMPVLTEAVDDYQRRIPTRDVNTAIRLAQSRQAAPGGARILYATQGATDPPTFTLFVNRKVPPTYLRYIERTIRETFDLGATPIKLRVRQRS